MLLRQTMSEKITVRGQPNKTLIVGTRQPLMSIPVVCLKFILVFLPSRLVYKEKEAGFKARIDAVGDLPDLTPDTGISTVLVTYLVSLIIPQSV